MATFSVNGKPKIRDYLIISAMKQEFHQYQKSLIIENEKTKYGDSHDGENIDKQIIKIKRRSQKGHTGRCFERRDKAYDWKVFVFKLVTNDNSNKLPSKGSRRLFFLRVRALHYINKNYLLVSFLMGSMYLIHS